MTEWAGCSEDSSTNYPRQQIKASLRRHQLQPAAVLVLVWALLMRRPAPTNLCISTLAHLIRVHWSHTILWVDRIVSGLWHFQQCVLLNRLLDSLKIPMSLYLQWSPVFQSNTARRWRGASLRYHQAATSVGRLLLPLFLATTKLNHVSAHSFRQNETSLDGAKFSHFSIKVSGRKCVQIVRRLW